MNNLNRLLLATALVLTIGQLTGIAAEPSAEFELRDPQGNKLIAADQIRFYDWGTHTLTLAPGTRAKLAAELLKSRRLVSGVPFHVTLGGKTVYEGNFTSLTSSKSFSTPIILVDPTPLYANVGEDQLRIQLGYPTNEFFRGDDPRTDERIRSALHDAGKLAKAIEEHTAWISASLLEMQTIKPGMTREQLLKVFQEEGGLSTRRERRYAYRDCPYIKVNVKFDPAEVPSDKSKEDPRDKITQISQPFLEWSIMD